jgi:hypothetical protein
VTLRPAVYEHLTRIAANHATCSRPTAFPRPTGLESGLWCRHPDGRATLVEVLFRLDEESDRILIRRILLREMDRLPGWVLNPAEWPGDMPWPVVDL